MDEKCHVDPIQKSVSAEEQQQLVTVNLAVTGMGCPNCAIRVYNGLLGLHGVVKADVNHETGLALVEMNPALVARPSLLEAVFQAGVTSNHNYSAALL